MPEDRHDALVVKELVKVVHERINHSVRKRVFLIQENTKENGVGSYECVLGRERE